MLTLHHFLDMIGANLDYTTLSLSKEDIVLLAVPSYGNRAYEDTLIELNDIAEKYDFQVISAIAAIAEHSIMHQYATEGPDPQDVEDLHTFSKKILEKLTAYNPVCEAALQIPGNRPHKKFGVASLVPKANKNYRQRKVYFLYALR